MDLPFATLASTNVLAKMAFSEVYETMMHRRQGSTTEEIPAFHRLRAEPEQAYHKDVLDFKREMEYKLSKGDISDSLSGTDTEQNVDSEADDKHLGMIWTGRHILGLQLQPFAPRLGWTAGKGSLEKEVDILLCTVFSCW